MPIERIDQQLAKPTLKIQSHSLAALHGHLERQCQRAHIGWTLVVQLQVIDPPFSTGWFLKCGPLVVSSEICLGSDRLCSGCLSDELFGGDHTRTTPHGAQ